MGWVKGAVAGILLKKIKSSKKNQACQVKRMDKEYRYITCGGMIAGGACPYKNCWPRPGAPEGYIGIRGVTEGIASGLI